MGMYFSTKLPVCDFSDGATVYNIHATYTNR
jgi:hypothetical protein